MEYMAHAKLFAEVYWILEIIKTSCGCNDFLNMANGHFYARNNFSSDTSEHTIHGSYTNL